MQKLFGREPHKGVNPDEVVAIGAAIKPACCRATSRTSCCSMSPSVARDRDARRRHDQADRSQHHHTNQESQVFSTAEDNQTAVTIRVFQGEREMAADNKLLGQFDLVGIPPAPRGVPQIEVTFDIDANGIVNVSAKDKASGKEQSIRIQASGGLSEADIQKMVREAEAHAEEDKRRKELVEARNQADAVIYSTEKALKESESKISADLKKQIEQTIADARQALTADDVQTIRQAAERLQQQAGEIGKAINRTASQEPGGQPGSSGGGSSGDDVVDAEFEEVDPGDRRAT